MRTTFPTLAEAPRAEWPVSLRVIPPDAQIIDGGHETIRCACGRAVPATEMMDFRALTVAQRAAIGLELVLCCAACFHLALAHGRILHGDVARTFGLAANVIASLDFADAHGVTRGHHVHTPRNEHLLPATAPSP